RVARSAIDEQRDHGAKNELIGNATDLRVVVEHDTRGARLRRQVTRHIPLVGRLERRRHSLDELAADERPRPTISLSAQRIGGAYWMPPLVHNLFSPRSILSG